jgi:hypothetical protein
VDTAFTPHMDDQRQTSLCEFVEIGAITHFASIDPQ